MAKRIIKPYDTYTRTELTELIQSQDLEIGTLKEEVSYDFKFRTRGGFTTDFQNDDGEGTAHEWSVAWSDLMMTMFIFFVVLYCYQISLHPPVWGETLGHERGTAVVGGARQVKTTTTDNLGEPAGSSFSSMYKEGRMALKDQDLGSFASLDLVNDKTMRVNLTGDLLFAKGRSELLPKARYFLLDLLPLLELAPYHIEVIGHADGSTLETRDMDGWELSLKRASKVAKTLMHSGGLNPQRFEISGVGAMDPVQIDPDLNDQSGNRRVEIILTLASLDEDVSVVQPLKSVLK